MTKIQIAKQRRDGASLGRFAARAKEQRCGTVAFGTSMHRLFSYVLRQLVGPVSLFIFLLSSVIWLSQSLRLLDLVINRGQSAPTFFYLTLLMLPSLLVVPGIHADRCQARQHRVRHDPEATHQVHARVNH